MLWGIRITGNLDGLEAGKKYSCVPEGEHEKLQERIKELEDDYTDLKEIQITDYNHAVRNAERIKELEQSKRLLRIVIAEALEECIGDDIEKATTILEQAPKGE